MSRIHRSMLLACSVVLVSCDAGQRSTTPLVSAARAILADAGSIAPTSTESGTISAQSLTLPFSGSYSGILAAFEVVQTGAGRAGVFRNSSSTNPRSALTAQSAGSSNALYASNTGTGPAAYLETTNASSPSSVLFVRSFASAPVIRVESNGHGNGVYSNAAGVSGAAGVFETNNSGNSSPTLDVFSKGSGNALGARTIGTGRVALFVSSNPIAAAAAVEVLNGALGEGGLFSNTNSNNANAAIKAQTEGSGVALLANQSGTSGSIAVFQANEVNQARIDRNGRGFFNGGTQNNGADIAEAFEVDGAISDYRQGDVLVISTRSDRRVTRSSEAYSSHVIGVYATKPGVLLTERGIDDTLGDMIPVGVVGVIPTRVSAENGAIRRGDILVSAATPGHAMRTDPVEVKGIKLYPSGAIIGKALENFAGPGTGVIKVLVNVK